MKTHLAAIAAHLSKTGVRAWLIAAGVIVVAGVAADNLSGKPDQTSAISDGTVAKNDVAAVKSADTVDENTTEATPTDQSTDTPVANPPIATKPAATNKSAANNSTSNTAPSPSVAASPSPSAPTPQPTTPAPTPPAINPNASFSISESLGAYKDKATNTIVRPYVITREPGHTATLTPSVTPYGMDITCSVNSSNVYMTMPAELPSGFYGCTLRVTDGKVTRTLELMIHHSGGPTNL